MKLGPFSANGIVDVDTWVERFERFSQRENVNAEQKYKDLQMCLIGNAELWYSTVAAKDPSIKDYATLKAALLERFAVLDKDDIPIVKQSDQETAEQYNYNFMAQIRFCILTEGQFIKLFIKGLNPISQPHMNLQQPKTLEEARRKAVDFESATERQPQVDRQFLIDTVTEVTSQVMSKLTEKLEELTTRSLQERQSRGNFRSQGQSRGRGFQRQQQMRQDQKNRQQPC